MNTTVQHFPGPATCRARQTLSPTQNNGASQ